MGAADYLLYRLAKVWPSPMAEQVQRIGGAEPGTEAHALAYTQEQFDRKVRVGLGIPVWDRDVLEIGCGHGGITCFIAAAGARSAVGIDLNVRHLDFARRFAAKVSAQIGAPTLRARFIEMNAYAMTFEPESFDLVIADNSFEHFSEPETVMQQAYRVLRLGGALLVPSFSSIYSKYGPHLKYGYHLPWTHLLFREKTIISAMRRLAKDNPQMQEIYPGLQNGAETFAGIRRYNDLNDITHRNFIRMAERTGLKVEWFKPFPTRAGYPLYAIRRLRRCFALDILSTGAAALLRKPTRASELLKS